MSLPRAFARVVVLLGAALTATAGAGPPQTAWPQWGQDPQHAGAAASVGQPAARILATAVYDRFARQEQNDPLSGGDLLVHYQTALVDDEGAVYLEFKTGTY